MSQEKVKMEDALSQHMIKRETMEILEDMDFATPPPIDGGKYWQFLPFPKTLLFQDILRQGQDQIEPQLEEPPNVDALELSVEMADDLHEKQEHLVQLAAAQYEWEKAKDETWKPYVQNMMRENEAKATIMMKVQSHLDNIRNRANDTQGKVLRNEIDKAIQEVGGTDGVLPDPTLLEDPLEQVKVETMQTSIGEALSKLGEVTKLKTDITRRRKEINSVAKPLRKHLKVGKHTYVKSGKFTKKKRATTAANARPYNQSGRHIKDFQNPRFRSHRDQQLKEYAERLRQPAELIQQSLVNK